MRLVIDCQALQSATSRTRGIGRQALALAQAMVRRRGAHEVLLALNAFEAATIDEVRGAFAGLLPEDSFRIWHGKDTFARRRPTSGHRADAIEIIYEAFLAGLHPDVVHVPSLFEGSSGNAVTSIGRFSRSYRTAVTLHDLIPMIEPERYLAEAGHRAWYFRKLEDLQRADLLLAISEATRQEAIGHLKVFPDRIRTISSGVDPGFRPVSEEGAARQAFLRSLGITRPFVMYTGGGDHRKNIPGLIRGFAGLPATLRQSHQLAVVCHLSPRELFTLKQQAHAHGLDARDVIFTGFVSDADLIRLYSACQLFVFPSLHEGFGLPILEAMGCGAPVIGADRTSLPEAIGRADALFDPDDDLSLVTLMQRALTDADFRSDLASYGTGRARQFTWELCADRAWKALTDTVAARPVPREPAVSILDAAVEAIAALDPVHVRGAHKPLARALALNHPTG